MAADWYCPECGERLSYGIYCKKCGEEREFAMRPAGELDRLVAYCQTMPAPEYPRYLNDE